LVENHPERVLDLLNSTRPRPGEADLRGFEWYYFWRKINPGLRAICSNPGGLGYKGVALSPDGSLVAISSGMSQEVTIKLFDVSTGHLKKTFTGGMLGFTLLAFSPDGQTLASLSEGSTLCLWDVAKGAQLARIAGKEQMARSLRYSHDGKRLAVG